MVTIINEDKLFSGMHVFRKTECYELQMRSGIDQQTSIKIFHKYQSAFDGDIQGACIIIADEIQKSIGGECVAGYLCMCGIKRSHWWVEKDDIIYDPMGDKYKNEWGFHREEAHRSKEEFDIILPIYEKYRL